ncbi:shikimate kinase [Peptococcaceae bacterium 1198_IL3148]
MKEKNIILIGFMGAGKSSVGSKLAEELDFDFMDTDKEIECMMQMDIPSIFRQYGESYFRSAETALLKRLASKQRTVISTGGGAPALEKNWQTLNQLGLVVYLYVTLDTAMQRTGGKNRPLLQQSRSQLESLWQKRQLTYQRAKYTVDTEAKSIEAVTKGILDFIELEGIKFTKNKL